MKFELKTFETGQRHDDMVDTFAYMVAMHYAKLQDEYIMLYVKKCPKWLPTFIYRWILSKVIVLQKFR